MKLRPILRILKGILTLLVAAASVFAMLQPLKTLATSRGGGSAAKAPEAPTANGGKLCEALLKERWQEAREGALSVEKVYWLHDGDAAPAPDQACYSSYASAAEAADFLERAQKLLKGEKTLFHTGIALQSGTSAMGYLDETIMAITWKQVIGGSAVTISEVKIAHPSQFRRYLTDHTYGSRTMKLTTRMAREVNAVVAASGDFHYNRPMGLVVYDGKVWREEDALVDTCHIDGNGDLHFTYAGRFANAQQAQQYVDELGIRFSISFGPALVENGQPVQNLKNYLIGQVNDRYSRAVLCQLGELHYVVATFNMEGPYRKVMNIHELQALMMQWGVQMAYTLDGGQTGTIAMNGKLINRPDWGEEKHISDIFYFATAKP